MKPPEPKDRIDKAIDTLETLKEILDGAAEMVKESGEIRNTIRERKLEANSIGGELMVLDKDIATQTLTIEMAQKEYDLNEKIIDWNNQIWQWHRNKKTGDNFFQFLKSEYSRVYYQSYNLVYDMARKAEQAYRYELGLDLNEPIIELGYWDPNFDGMVAGERLYNGLRKLEQSWVETRHHDFEIEKVIPFSNRSLTQATDGVEFDVTEDDFDRDFPGHFRRRIKTVSLVVPNSPGTNLSCTLTLLQHRYRVKDSITDASAYKNSQISWKTLDSNFRSDKIPIEATYTAISGDGTSSSSSEMFEMKLDRDEYLPFEGAGAISQWKLEFPPWNYAAAKGLVSKMVLKIKYIGSKGSDQFKEVVKTHGSGTFK